MRLVGLHRNAEMDGHDRCDRAPSGHGGDQDCRLALMTVSTVMCSCGDAAPTYLAFGGIAIRCDVLHILDCAMDVSLSVARGRRECSAALRGVARWCAQHRPTSSVAEFAPPQPAPGKHRLWRRSKATKPWASLTSRRPPTDDRSFGSPCREERPVRIVDLSRVAPNLDTLDRRCVWLLGIASRRVCEPSSVRAI